MEIDEEGERNSWFVEVYKNSNAEAGVNSVKN